ncbi:MAG TPA: DJ-1/PfpI family protein [Actinomycetota bacterium]|nr:DJ-1/PfpI family protein [Actinomycetota bacterium]
MPDADEKTIAFVVYPGLTPLDLIGPLEVFAATSFFAPHIHAATVAERREPMSTDCPVEVIPEHTFDEVPDPYAVVVPGGQAPCIRAMANDAIREYLTSADEHAEMVTSVCTGALVLGAAGLLEGRKATTHWAYARLLEKLGAQYLPERWVQDGKFLTSAGVSAGIDMALHLAALLTDEATARMAQIAIEYDPRPPFGGIDWSGVNRDMWAPMVEHQVREELADHPDLLARLSG